METTQREVLDSHGITGSPNESELHTCNSQNAAGGPSQKEEALDEMRRALCILLNPLART